MKPTIGRHVIYNDGANQFAAIITRVHNDTCVNLAVFTDDQTLYVTSVTLGPIGANTWRWPARD